MTPITDWNWFFSSLSQCGAALIGIIAAFIISKLLNENEKKERIYQTLRDFNIEYNNLQKRLSYRYFEWYNEFIMKTNQVLQNAVDGGTFDRQSIQEKEDTLYNLIPSLYYSKRNLEQLQFKLDNRAPNIYGFINQAKWTDTEKLPPNTNNNTYLQLFDTELHEIELIEADCLNLSKRFEVAEDDINIFYNNLTIIRIIIYISMIGFLGSVVYPLHFMPMSDHAVPQIILSFSVFWGNLLSIQGILLLILSIIIEGIFIYFLFLIKSIKKGYSDAKADIKPEYLTLSGYSEYFKNKE
jgi:hypothetical protein